MQCSVRVVDPELQINNPCYREMEKYLQANYLCTNGSNKDYERIPSSKFYLSLNELTASRRKGG